MAELNIACGDSITLDKILGDTAMPQEDKKRFIEDKLMSTGRQGIQNVVQYLERSDFYRAPSSTRFHSNYMGGLVDHSILVMQTALHIRESVTKIWPDLAAKIPEESVILTALLHDICKCNFYKDGLKWKKNDETGQWMQIPVYEVDDKFPVGHGEKSVIMLLMLGLQLKPEEIVAIRYHMGLWSKSIDSGDDSRSYFKAVEKTPLLTVLQTADFISSFSFEPTINN